MQPRAGTARRLLPAALLLIALGASACGSSESEDATAFSAAPEASEFPQVEGRTLEQLAADEASESDLVVLPTAQDFDPGTNRLGFGVFTLDNEQIPDADVAIYAARPDGKAVGPFPAAAESLVTDAAFQSQGTSSDPDAAKTVYTSQVELDGEGEWRLLALVREEDGSYGYVTIPSAVVRETAVPDVGEKAPVIHTPTAEDVGGDLTKIDTRQPPSTMHEHDYADVVGVEPVALLFATPALCTSRVCGPVVDIAEQVKSERPDDAAFIHMEIYNNNSFEDGLREQVKAFNLRSEPWLFVIDSDGKVSTEIEGAFSERELNEALDEVAAGS
jgi:hypothetical protein